MNKKMKLPELDYLDWCKKNKKARSVQETERRDWIQEYYLETNAKINGLQFAIMLGMNPLGREDE
jgi:hypothetical protein